VGVKEATDGRLVDIQVGVGEGHVVLQLPVAVEWLALEPDQARAMALALWRMARVVEMRARPAAKGGGAQG
jgi:hypothetical protein